MPGLGLVVFYDSIGIYAEPWSTFSTILNSSVNFFVYMAASRPFRKAFWSWWSCIRGKQLNVSVSFTQSTRDHGPAGANHRGCQPPSVEFRNMHEWRALNVASKIRMFERDLHDKSSFSDAFLLLNTRVCLSVRPSYTQVKFLRNEISGLNLNKIASGTWYYAIRKVK